MKMINFARGLSYTAIASAASMAAVTSAHAAFDVTAITAAGADIALVGGAVFTVIVSIKVFQWVRRAL